MINAILKGIMSLVIGLVNVVLAPIDALISAALPDLSNALTAVASLFNLVSQYIGFAISMLGLSNETLSLIVMYWVFKLTVPLTVSAVKTAIRWYDKLKI